jgi:hypothetical protein
MDLAHGFLAASIVRSNDDEFDRVAEQRRQLQERLDADEREVDGHLVRVIRRLHHLRNVRLTHVVVR